MLYENFSYLRHETVDSGHISDWAQYVINTVPIQGQSMEVQHWVNTLNKQSLCPHKVNIGHW